MQSFSLAPPHLCAPAPISKGFEIFKGYGDRGKVMGGRGRRRRPPFFHTCLQPFTPVMFCGRVFYTRRDVGSGCCAEKRWGRGRWGGGGKDLEVLIWWQQIRPASFCYRMSVNLCAGLLALPPAARSPVPLWVTHPQSPSRPIQDQHFDLLFLSYTSCSLSLYRNRKEPFEVIVCCFWELGWSEQDGYTARRHETLQENETVNRRPAPRASVHHDTVNTVKSTYSSSASCCRTSNSMPALIQGGSVTALRLS